MLEVASICFRAASPALRTKLRNVGTALENIAKIRRLPIRIEPERCGHSSNGHHQRVSVSVVVPPRFEPYDAHNHASRRARLSMRYGHRIYDRSKKAELLQPVGKKGKRVRSTARIICLPSAAPKPIDPKPMTQTGAITPSPPRLT